MASRRPIIGFQGSPNEFRELVNGDALIVQRFADTNGLVYLQVATVASQVNGFVLYPAASGDAPKLAAYGADTDIDVTLYPKGAGKARTVLPSSVSVDLVDVVSAQTLYAKNLLDPTNQIPWTAALKAVRQYVKNPGATTFSNVGWAAGATITAAGGVIASADADVRPLLRIKTAASSGAEATFVSATVIAGQWGPRLVFAIRTGSDSDRARIWIGLFDVNPLAHDDLADTPAVGVGFRWSYGTDTNWQFGTFDGSDQDMGDTGVEWAPDTDYVFEIIRTDTSWIGIVNGAQVDLHSFPPPDSTMLAIRAGVHATDAADRSLLVGSNALWMR